jgi:hypothetical protein
VESVACNRQRFDYLSDMINRRREPSVRPNGKPGEKASGVVVRRRKYGLISE